MDKIEKIRQEIERLKSTNPSEYNYQNAEGYVWALDDLLSFIDTLSEEPDKSLKEVAEKYADETYYAYPPEFLDFVKEEIRDAFLAGAKWQANHAPLPEDTVLFQKGVEEGKRLMMEGAVEYEVMDFSSSLETHPFVSIPLDNKKYRFGDTVRIIILPKED